MHLQGWFRWTVWTAVVTQILLASGRLLPQRHDKRSVPESVPPSDPYEEFWKQHNHGLCPLGMVSQRNNTVCCLPTSCKPGYGLVACSINGSEDVCIPCKEGYVQRLNVSSLNMMNTACFKEVAGFNNLCSLVDFNAVETGSYSKGMPLSCECALEKCHWPETSYKDASSCKTEDPCPAHHQLSKLTGVCEECPWYADKDQPGCWPCVINVTLLRLGRPETSPSPTVEQDIISKESKSHGHEPFFGIHTIISLVSVLGTCVLILGLILIILVCRHHNCRQQLRDYFSKGPSQGSAQDLLSPQTRTPTTPTINDGHSNLVNMRASSTTDALQNREAQSLPVEARPKVHNSTNVRTPCRGSLINQGQINGANASIGHNTYSSSPINHDSALEPLLPLNPDETLAKSTLYPDLSGFLNTTGSTSNHGKVALRQLDEFYRIYQPLNTEISMRDDTIGDTLSEDHGIDDDRMHTGSNSVRVAAVSDDLSTNRTRDLKAIGVEPSREKTIQKSKFSSGTQFNNKKCKGNNDNNGNANARAGGLAMNFNAKINNSVINIDIDHGVVRMGGDEELGRCQLQRLQGRTVPATTINEASGYAATLLCNNMNEGISELPSRCENVESGVDESNDYNISVVERNNRSDKATEEEHSHIESTAVKKVYPSVVADRPVGVVAPFLHSTVGRQSGHLVYHSNMPDHSNISSRYGLSHMSPPLSHITQNALNSEESEVQINSRHLVLPRHTSSNRANAGSLSSLPQSTELQMQRLEVWNYASETLPKTVDYDEDEVGLTVEPQGLQEIHDPDQTERKEAAHDRHGEEQTKAKRVAGLDED
ncbi:uncharacterized protein LOC127830975 isoform X2 [Dreissena polymorpha]|uniref:uncharacterized protein LOC127830975 isoform X2 n=1 Tax=Dreissena polymorpha TaxID=45954 RepID=UPI002265245D|nr:uncharacterized protein LOC127830975 isoform X2 [Dreissena polymorpha]